LKISIPLLQHQNALLVMKVHVDFERRYNDLLNMVYPLWFVEMKMLTWLKCYWTWKRMWNWEDLTKVSNYTSVTDSYPSIFHHVKANIISVAYHMDCGIWLFSC